MVTIRLDPSRLSLEELQNVTRMLRERCADCIEGGVHAGETHRGEVTRFLHALADAIDQTRVPLEHREQERALGVDSRTGEWLAGA